MTPYLGAYVVLYTAGILLLRSRLGSGESLHALVADLSFQAGVVCHTASCLTWMLALRHFEITRALPVFLGLSYVAATVGAVVILGEHLRPRGLPGSPSWASASCCSRGPRESCS